MDVFVHRLRAGMEQMLASLGQRPDAIVFTDVIGETEPTIRDAACRSFEFLGLRVDPGKNAGSPLDADIATADNAVRILIVESREAWQIARECHALVAI